MRTADEIAKTIVESLFPPGDLKDWGQSPKSVEELAQDICSAIRQVREEMREACAEVAWDYNAEESEEIADSIRSIEIK